MSCFASSRMQQAFAAPNLSRRPSRAAAVTVQANKLIKGANRPAVSKKASAKKAFELNLQKLYTDAEFLPGRQIGPVEVAAKSGRGRCVTAKEDLRPGALLFVSETVGSALTGQLGQNLQPQDLQAHWTSSGQKLTAADRYKLSLLHRPSNQSPPTSITFKDFSEDKASTKAKKAAASKGFGATSAAAKQASAAAAAVATELTAEQLGEILSCNAYGDDHLDGPLTTCRGSEQGSIIGVWPEFALLNHSCAPNTVPPVLLKDRLLLRSALTVPAGEELTTSYLGLAGGLPLQQRRQLLQHYGFTCRCHRCKAEESAPADVQATLQAMHESSSSIDTPQLLQAMAQGDTAAVQQIHDKASSLVQQLEQQLGQVTEPIAVNWLKASAYDTYAMLLRTADWLTGLKDLHAAQKLADLVKVFAPASEPHHLLLSDSIVRSAEASAAGKVLNPEDSEEVRVQRFVQALVLRYGEVKLEQLTALAGATQNALGPHWLGLTDINGELGLEKLVKAASAAADGSRQKVELNLGQLGGPAGTGQVIVTGQTTMVHDVSDMNVCFCRSVKQ